MRRRALLASSAGLLGIGLAGCVGQSDALVDRTVRQWQSEEQRSFTVDTSEGDTIRIELKQTQSDGAGYEIYRPDQWDGIRVADISPHSYYRDPLGTVEYDVEEGGPHTVVVHPCCADGGGTSFAWVRIYVD